MPFRFTTAFLVIISGSAAWAAPAPEWFLADGVVTTGTLDSAIGDYGFMTHSAMGTKIFAACKMDDLCEAKITANADSFIAQVDRVRKVGPFATPRDLIDFIYSHYVGWSTRGFSASGKMVDKLYSPRFAALVSAADAKADKLQEESPAAGPWMSAQEWKLAGYTIAVADRGPRKAQATATFTNLEAPGARPETFTFDVVDGGSGWLIDDVVTRDGPEGGVSHLSDDLRKYLASDHGPDAASSTPKRPEVTSSPRTDDRSRTSLDQGSLCDAEQTAIFSCKIRGRIASLCASRDLGPGKGVMAYRFGKPGAIELAYPEPGTAPSKAFTAAVVDRGDYVRFVRNGTSYKLYSLVLQGRSPFAGIRIEENGRKVADLRCDRGADALGPDNWSLMYKAQLPVDSERYLDP